MRRALLVLAAVATVLMASATAVADPPGPVGTGDPVINLAGGFTYSIISTACTDSVTSTESGARFNMPEDFDANITVRGKGGTVQLLSAHELTKPVAGDFQGDAGKCHVDEQATSDDGDSDGWASVSRLTLGKDGTTVTEARADHDRPARPLRGREDAVGHLPRRTRSSPSSTTRRAARAGSGRSIPRPARRSAPPAWAG